MNRVTESTTDTHQASNGNEVTEASNREPRGKSNGRDSRRVAHSHTSIRSDRRIHRKRRTDSSEEKDTCIRRVKRTMTIGRFNLIPRSGLEPTSISILTGGSSPDRVMKLNLQIVIVPFRCTDNGLMWFWKVKDFQ